MSGMQIEQKRASLELLFLRMMVLIVLAPAVQAQQLPTEALPGSRKALIPSVFYSTDSDRLSIQVTTMAAAPRFVGPEQWTQWSLGHRAYRQNDWQLTTRQLGYSVKNEDRFGLGYHASVTLNDLDSQWIVTTENRLGWRVSPRSVAEALVLRDLVESQEGLATQRTYLMVGGSLETQWSSRWGSVMGLDGRWFSDHNARYTGKAKLIFDALPAHGVTLQGWYQNFRNSDTDASASAYFSPQRYEETLMVLGFRRRLPGLHLRLRVGMGTQQVSETGPSRAQFSDLMLEWTDARKWRWRLDAGYRLSAGVSDDPNYRYRYGGLVLTIPWK